MVETHNVIPSHSEALRTFPTAWTRIARNCTRNTNMFRQVSKIKLGMSSRQLGLSSALLHDDDR